MLNLAKNPTGLNQNISLMEEDPREKGVFILVNDHPNDGTDVSWIWDVDFERLVGRPGLRVFAGGTRAGDVQVRLKYAGIDASIARARGRGAGRDGRHPHLAPAGTCSNYSALFPTKAEPRDWGQKMPSAEVTRTDVTRGRPAVAGPHRAPVSELLNLYGDSGNILVLRKAPGVAGLGADVMEVSVDDTPSLFQRGMVFIGAAPTASRGSCARSSWGVRSELAAFVEDGGVLAALRRRYQLLG